MRRPFRLTPSAARDIDEILEYVLEHDGPRRALHVHERLSRGISRIAASPGIGHVREDLADRSLRVWPVFSYLIIYRPESKPLEIIRVIHGARELRRLFESDESPATDDDKD